MHSRIRIIFFIIAGWAITHAAPAQSSILDRVFLPIKDGIISQINKQISGSIDIGSIRIYPPNQVALYDVRLYERKNKQHLIARIGQAQIYVALLKLIYGGVELTGITLTDPYFYLELIHEETNIVRALQPTTTTDEPPITLTLPNIKLSGGEFEFVTDSNFDMASHDIVANGKVEIKKGKLKILVGQVSSKSGLIETTGMRFPYTNLHGVTTTITEDWLSAAKLTVLVEGSSVQAAGSLNYTDGTFDIQGKTHTKPHYYPNGLIPLPFATPSVQADFSLTGFFTAPVIAVMGSCGEFEIFGNQLAAGSFSTEITTERVIVTAATFIPSSGGQIEGEANYLIDSEKLSISAQLKNLDAISALRSVKFELAGAGRVSGAVNLTGRIFGTQQWQADFNGGISGAQALGAVFPTNLALRTRFNYSDRSGLDFQEITLNSDSVHAEAQGRYNLISNEFAFTYAGALTNSKNIYPLWDSIFEAHDLELTGDISSKRKQLNMNSTLTIHSLNSFGQNFSRIAAEITVANKMLIVDQVSSLIGGGRAFGRGQLELDHDHKVHASLTISKAYLAGIKVKDRLLPLSGEFSSQLEITGPVKSPTANLVVKGSQLLAYDVAIPKFDATVELAQYVISVSELRAQLLSGSLSSQSVTIDLKQNKIKAQGKFSTINLAQIAPLAQRQLAGEATGAVIISGSINSPAAQSHLRLENLIWDRNKLGNGIADFVASNSMYQLALALRTDSGGISLRSAYSSKTNKINAVIDLDHLLMHSPSAWSTTPLRPLGALATGTVVAAGVMPMPQVNAQLKFEQIKLVNQPIEASQIDEENIFAKSFFVNISLVDSLLQATLKSGLGPEPCSDIQCIDLTISGKIAAIDSFSLTARGDFEFTNIERVFNYTQNEIDSLSARLSLDAHLTKSPWFQSPSYRGTVKVSSLKLAIPAVPEITLNIPSEFKFSKDTFWFTNKAVLTAQGSPITISGGLQNRLYDMTIDGEIPLLIGKLLTPAIIGAEGSVQTRVHLSGTLDNPRPQGVFTPMRGALLSIRNVSEALVFIDGSTNFSYIPGSQLFKIETHNLRAEYGEGLFLANGFVLIDGNSLTNSPIIFRGPSQLKIVADNILFKSPKFWASANLNTTLATSAYGVSQLNGKVTILDGVYQDKFTFNDFVFSRKEKSKFSFDIFPLVELDLSVDVETLEAKADTPICNVDARLTADLTIANNSHSPYFKGKLDVVDGTIKFPQTVFQIEPSAMTISGYPGKIDTAIHLRALGYLNPASLIVSENTAVELSLKGDLNSARLDFVPISGNKTLDRLKIIGFLIDPGQFFLGDLRAEIERLLTSKGGSKPLLTTSLKTARQAAKLEWQMGPRLQLEGTAAWRKSIQFEDLILRLSIFDHLPVGKSLAVEGEILSPSSISTSEPTEHRIRLQYRILEK